MGYTPEELATRTQMLAFNSEPYDVSTNAYSFAHPATPVTFPLALQTAVDLFGHMVDRFDGIGVGHFTISTSTPSGGQDGDVWFQVPG